MCVCVCVCMCVSVCLYSVTVTLSVLMYIDSAIYLKHITCHNIGEFLVLVGWKKY